MKKLICLLSAMFCATLVYSQDKPYEVDNGSIVVSKVVNDIPGSASDIYVRAKNYFARTYNDSNSVIQTDDKEGGIIIGKGLFGNIVTFGMPGLKQNYIDGHHILRIDIKDGRARIICSAAKMDVVYPDQLSANFTYDIINYSPFKDKAPRAPVLSKKKAAEAFDQLVVKMQAAVESCAAALLEGGVLNAEKEDW